MNKWNVGGDPLVKDSVSVPMTMLSQGHVCASLVRSSDVVGSEEWKMLTGLPPPSLYGETNALADAHTTRLIRFWVVVCGVGFGYLFGIGGNKRIGCWLV